MDSGKEVPSIVMAHGFGANMDDLTSLSVESEIQANWLFPQAPIPLQPGSYAWFPSDRESLEAVFAGAYFSRIEEMEVPELDRRSDELMQDLREMGIDIKNCFLGGFSQGSMLAVRTWLRHRADAAGLIILSGSLIARESSADLAGQAPKIPVFQSHGTMDPVLPFSGAQALREMLESRGLDVDFHAFPGQHGVPPEICRDMGRFISGQTRQDR
jgi:phospholipase/carboxylesterase